MAHRGEESLPADGVTGVAEGVIERGENADAIELRAKLPPAREEFG
jgi:hypothetical protein